MAKTYPLILTTDTFQQWLNRTNALTTDLSTIIVTTDATVAGAVTTGNASIDGNLDADIVSVATGIRGGDNTTGNLLNVLNGLNVTGVISATGAVTLTSTLTVSGQTSLDNTTVSGAFVSSGTSSFAQPINADITGNAATATQLQTARLINLVGDVTGSGSFDGSGDVTITTTQSGVDVLAGLLPVDGAGSGLDADLLDGLEGTMYVRKDQDNTITGNITSTSSTLTDGINVWKTEIVSGNLIISYNGSKVFKLDGSGNLTVKGDITAFGTV